MRLLSAAVAFVGCLTLPGAFSLACPRVISSAASSSISASGDSLLPIFSANGRYLFFLSAANNLVPNEDHAPYLQVFRRDILSGDVILVSENISNGGGANKDCRSIVASGNGQLIAFSSSANNLTIGDTNDAEDVFLRNLSTGSTLLVSADIEGKPATNPFPRTNRRLCGHPLISQDGMLIAFESRATNMVTQVDTNADSDVFVRYLDRNETVLASVSPERDRAGNAGSELMALTPDGRFILFRSRATNLVSAPVSTGGEALFVRDLRNETTALISADVSTFFPDSTTPVYGVQAVMTSDAKFAAFKAGPSNATTGLVLYRALESNITSLVATNSRFDSPLQISPDGRFVAYDSGDRVYVWDGVLNSRRPISDEGKTALNPVLSASGTRIAYLIGTNTSYQIEAQDLSSSNVWPVSQTASGIASSENHQFSAFGFDSSETAVVFDSFDDSLVTNDFNRASDVFLRWFETGETHLLSTAHQERVGLTANGPSHIGPYSLSDNGMLMVFASHASNLTSTDSVGPRDAFVKNLASGAATALTPNAGFVWENSRAAFPVISGNGRYAVFVGRKAKLGGASSLALARVDLVTGQALEISDVNDQVLNRFGRLFSFSIDRNGQTVAYTDAGQLFFADLSAGTNRPPILSLGSGEDALLSPDATGLAYIGPQGVTVRELQQGTNIVIGADFQQHFGLAFFRRPTFSADSRYLVYATADFKSVIYDRLSGSISVVCTSCDNPSVSGDGRFVVYESFETGARQTVVKERPTGKTSLISKNIVTGAGGDGDSTSPVITPDGRFIAFKSKGSNLVLNDTNGWADLFVHDLLQSVTLRIAPSGSDTHQGGGPVSQVFVSADSHTLIFSTFSAHMVANDYNNAQDLFVLKLAANDSDNDGMPDDWEAAYFGSLDHDGTADSDDDGHTDLQEYVAGTDPTNENSVLRVFTLTSASIGQTQLFWGAVPGKTYRVEYKNDLNETTWGAFPNLVTATSSTASATDTTSAFGRSRFYRVVAVQ
jgi:Tol biopolymer transport system component